MDSLPLRHCSYELDTVSKNSGGKLGNYLESGSGLFAGSFRSNSVLDRPLVRCLTGVFEVRLSVRFRSEMIPTRPVVDRYAPPVRIKTPVSKGRVAALPVNADSSTVPPPNLSHPAYSEWYTSNGKRALEIKEENARVCSPYKTCPNSDRHISHGISFKTPIRGQA